MEPFATTTLGSVALGLLPVTVFLIALVLIDSYKLVPLRLVVSVVLVGCIVALVCLWTNPLLMRALNLGGSDPVFKRYVSPINEEVFKALFVVFLIKRKRIGFMVDGSIYGFAIGAGFAIVENVVNLTNLENELATWIIRGFGTAIMHGGATAIVGIISVYYASRSGSHRWTVYLPGLGLAIVIHSFFNHFYLDPRVTTLALLTILPIVVGVVFRASERGTRDWLGVRFDTDAELLDMINTGKTSESRVGEYFQALQARFSGEVVADMLCMLRIHLELSVRAKGMLLMKEAGFRVQPDPDVEERLTELRYLEKSIGKTGRIAVSPILNMSDKDLWELHMLGKR
jgi:RsiW-degrading membrane proteinase PrsW (M82 family)